MTGADAPGGLAGLRWAIDVHVLDAHGADLRRLAEEGWVRLVVTDTAHTEISAARDPAKRQRLGRDLAERETVSGPWVLGHSVLGLAKLASETGGERLVAVFATLWPSHDYRTDGAAESGTPRTRFRDALHVATAMTGEVSGFVTADRRMLGRAPAVADRFGGFRILSVDEATAESLAAVEAVREEAARSAHPDPALLPAWPPSNHDA